MATALKKSPPRFQVGTTEADLLAQQQRLQGRVDQRGNAPRAEKRLGMVNSALTALRASPPPMPAPTPNPLAPVNASVNSSIADILSQLGSQGSFQPGDYSQQVTAAQNSVMDEFNRRMQPQFAKQDEDWRQRMAEQGIDPNSERAKFEYQQMQASQGDARQGAMNAANQAGLAAQAQGFGQDFSRWQGNSQMPLQQLGALSPFYQGQVSGQLQQGQQDFTAGQNALDRQQQFALGNQGFDFQKELAALQHRYNMALQAAAPRGGGGGGGLSYDQQLQLLREKSALDVNGQVIVNGLAGQNGVRPSAGTGFANGLANGIGVGVGAGLAR